MLVQETTRGINPVFSIHMHDRGGQHGLSFDRSPPPVI